MVQKKTGLMDCTDQSSQVQQQKWSLLKNQTGNMSLKQLDFGAVNQPTGKTDMDMDLLDACISIFHLIKMFLFLFCMMGAQIDFKTFLYALFTRLDLSPGFPLTNSF